MALKNKKKVYLSLNEDLIQFIEEKSNSLKITKSKYISTLLNKEHDFFQKKKIEQIIEGVVTTKEK